MFNDPVILSLSLIVVSGFFGTLYVLYQFRKIREERERQNATATDHPRT